MTSRRTLLEATCQLPRRDARPHRQYEDLLTGNPIFKERTEGIGVLTGDDALALGVSGPTLRAWGVAFDLRKRQPLLRLRDAIEFASRPARSATATTATWFAWRRCARA